MGETQLTRPHLPNTELVRSHINSSRLETSSAFTALGPLFPDYSFTGMEIWHFVCPWDPLLTLPSQLSISVCLSIRSSPAPAPAMTKWTASNIILPCKLDLKYEKLSDITKKIIASCDHFSSQFFFLKKIRLESSPAWGSTAVKVVRPQLWWVTWCRLYPGTRKSPPPLTFWPTGAGSSSGEKTQPTLKCTLFV